MAVYQVPQFLDSGDKIVFGMTVWQLLYAMVGFFISIGLFSLVTNALPWLGIWSFVPVIPVAALALFLALGKFNGRDSDIYVLKFILMLAKPRRLVYKRQPDNLDLDTQLAKLTPKVIEKEWESRLQANLADDSNPLSDFRDIESERKAEIIRQMGSTLDDTLYNTLQSVSRKQLQVEAKQSFLQNLRAQNARRKPIFGSLIPQNQDNQDTQDSTTPVSEIDLPLLQPKINDYLANGRDFNFFDLDHDGELDHKQDSAPPQQ